MKRILAIFLLMFSAATHASDDACQALAAKVLTLKADASAVWGTYPCKAMPDDPSKTIIVLGDEVAVVRNDSGEIISRGPLRTIPADFQPASIDTAPYWLTPTVRGFGIRFTAYFPHYHGGENHETMNMYVVEGEDIRPVMELLITKLEGYVASDDEASEEEGREQSKWTTQSEISIAKTRHHGYADLIVKTYYDSRKTVSHKLIYDAKRYVGPPDLMEDPVSPVQ